MIRVFNRLCWWLDWRQKRRRVAVEQAVAVLNEALEADPVAMLGLFQHGVSVNDALADHPTIQVDSETGTAVLRPLGLINGLFGVDADNWGYIAMVCTPTADGGFSAIECFEVLDRQR